ncbi:hypothetical protein K493DRAFT_211961 [Basidiobolus meristosporus CBS 931.73]|uniref:THIF-type NAD/FAD binding fold domain-containing protein n=1 Tax=Basidiobolus meristosporus CBS 931.73 TaxID=1314790 RepID=A0A1Y1YQK9_9FUNG|nr:hypothetical protein K493DRAFT_246854 [Basidiobolus meristosporus CBS 931.73]ORX99854.1 hypothetical protein K493DRAFT_211961 [Basidiobolus meristosporus CBS 931.73]|eukprot:ORX75861.1 hypothetical protein K493DRAFT_246854 [Basidiobolus meristosporus CBS 931.73]
MNLENLTHLLKDHKVQVLLTAGVSSLVTALTLLRLQKAQAERISKKLKAEVKEDYQEYSVEDPLLPQATVAAAADDRLLREQFSRNIAFLGEEGVQKLRNASVVIVGCGSIGSWVALMLLRSGVGSVKIIDHGEVTRETMNQHALATVEDIGIPNAVVLKKHIREIVPHAKVEAVIDSFSKDTASWMLEGQPDYVLDCVQDLQTKVDLLKYCHDHQLRAISTSYAGGKADPSRIQISDLSDTFDDPWARVLRRKLRKLGVENNIGMIHSIEKPTEFKTGEWFAAGEYDQYAIYPEGRIPTLPTFGTLAAIFGMSMASWVICELAEHKVQPLFVKQKDNTFSKLKRDLVAREEKNTFSASSPGLSKSEAGYVLEELWRSRSALSGALDKLALTRWDRHQPLTIQNCICLTVEEADRHDNMLGKLEDNYPEEFIRFVQSRFAEERKIFE